MAGLRPRSTDVVFALKDPVKRGPEELRMAGRALNRSSGTGFSFEGLVELLKEPRK